MNDITENAVIAREPQSPVAVTPMTLIDRAMQSGASMEQLEKLLDLKDRWDAAEAKRAFTEAIAAFKADPPRVVKDKLNKQYNSRYSSIGNTVNTVNECLGQHGLHARWDIHQDDMIAVTCILTHRMGHSESSSMRAGPDTSGAKNPLQQIKSTVTYLKLATFEAVTGVASVEGNLDDDGNGAGRQEVEPDTEGKKALEACASLDSLQAAWKALTAAQRKTLAGVKEACKHAIKEADAQ